MQENVALNQSCVARMHVAIVPTIHQDLAHHVVLVPHRSSNASKAQMTNAALMAVFAKSAKSVAMVNVALSLKPARIMFANLFDCNLRAF